ncbi:hypothetical protein DS958_00010 [Escherichia coli]|uniref:hypothetical protein n=1 Tax=Gammaproteobacteria TaxID=1236 RepID=UPI000B5C334E|nr:MULTISPECIES: hypothetical protein [Gammaproteobacteria]RBX77562.1 hypothetical protein DS977_17225 [Escherichia coli]RBY39036.1 hypothetical protein DS958_00010 [Escherichia coli]
MSNLKKGFFYLGGFLLLAWVGKAIWFAVPSSSEVFQNEKLAFDFSHIQINEKGCEVTNEDGKKLVFKEGEKLVLIPKGTLITGECFVTKKIEDSED